MGGAEETPPSSPGIPVDELPEELYQDDVAEEIDVGEGHPDPEGDTIDSDEELVELPGGIDQLEALIEEREEAMEELAQEGDTSRLVFSKHEGSVFCCGLNPGAGLAVTGGEDDKAYVWRIQDGGIEQELSGWSDSVTCCAWSPDCGLLALADMAGNIRVLRSPGLEKVWSFEVGDVLWVKWHTQANVLFAGTADSQLWMWKIPGGESKVFMGAGEKVESFGLTCEGRRAVAGYTDGSLRIFDLRSGETNHTLPSAQAHKDTVNEVLCHPGRELAVSAGMDGLVGLWNTNTGKQLGVLLCGDSQEPESPHSVEALALPQEKSTNLLVTGTLSGTVTVWDLATQVARTTIKVGEGVTVMRLGSGCEGDTVYCATLEGAVRALDIRTGAPVMEYTGHRGSLLDLQLDTNSSCLLTAGDDGTARIFDIRYKNS